MGQPYVGEIRMLGFSFAPNGWMECCGQLLPISENEVLFQLIGTTYGGDGEETFALPSICSRLPIHIGSNGGSTYQLGEMGGVESVTLTVNQIPIHNHPPNTNNAGGADNPTNNFFGKSNSGKPYANVPGGVLQNFSNTIIQPTGGSQPHENMHPFLVITFAISLFGVFPSVT